MSAARGKELVIERELVRRVVPEPPFEARPDWQPGMPRPAAVIVPVLFDPDPQVLAIVRSAVGDHAGEVAFPGGKPEGDETIERAALRECEEEVGLGSDDLEIVGGLQPIPVITKKFLIHPLVALVAPEAEPRVASSEVTALLRFSLAPLLDGTEEYEALLAPWRGKDAVFPHFRRGEHVLYGASALIFYELVTRVAAALGRDLPRPKIVDRLPWGDRYGGAAR